MNNDKSTASLAFIANTKKIEKAYWLNRLSGQPKKSSFPFDFDYERDGTSIYRLETINFSLPGEISRQFIELSKGSDARLFIFLMAGIFILLRKYSGDKDILVGIPVSRPREIVDLLNSALPIRYFFDDTLTYPQLLSKLGQILIEAEKYQNFPVRVLSDLLGFFWSRGEGFPLFDVVVSLRDIHQDTLLEFSPNIMISFESNGSGIAGVFSYNTERYRSDTITRLINHYLALLAFVLANPNEKISNIELLSKEEKQQILESFNNTAADFPETTTVHELINRQAEQTPHADAVVYQDQRLSYAELKNKTDCLASELRERGLGPDQIAAVIMNHIPEMVVALIGILKSGAAYLPIDPEYPPERIAYILKDSGAKMLVTTNDKEGEKLSVRGWEGEKVLLEEISQFPKNSSYPLTLLPSYLLNSSNLAYIIYTSGSTGKPKGVMIQHKSFIDFTTWAVIEFEHCPGYQVLLSNSYASDGSIQQIFPTLISGGALHLIDKELRLDVAHYLDYLRTHRINNIDEVPVLMKELLAQFDPNDREEKLPDLTCLSLGSEYVPIDLVKKCRRHLNHHGRIINAYGPAEASVETTTYHCDGTLEDEQSLIGKPRRNIQVYILDEAGHLCPIGVRGEICISGVGLARGYLNQPELTAERFNRSHKSYRTYILYKTGDRGCWLPDGNIRFFGRIDDQIKIRGNRVELQEVENVLKGHREIKDAVVLTRENRSGEIEICAYYVPKSGAIPLLQEYIKERLPLYMMPSYLIELDKIPLTPNGKIDRRALPKPELKISESYTGPRDEIEKKLVELWSDILDKDALSPSQQKRSIGIDDNFFQLGGHSLKATKLVSRIEKVFHVKIPLFEIFKDPRIRELARYIKDAVKKEYKELELVEKKEYYSLASAQKRLHFLQQMDKYSTAYNIPSAMQLEGSLDKDKLGRVMANLIRRHESLRTSFVIIREEPVQRIHDGAEFEIEYKNLATDEHGQTRTSLINFVRPFDLSNAPLLRVGLVKLEEEKHFLMVDMHHIISDGISSLVLVQDFSDLYSGKELPAIKFQYKDYAEWQSSESVSNRILEQGEYWKKEFAGEVPVLELPLDYARPAIQGFTGDRITFEMNSEISEALKILALESGTTLYIVLLACYTILLSKLTGQEDIIVGSPVAGRRHPDLEKIIGMFVNTMAMRNYPVGEKKFLDFLGEVKDRVLQAFENQEYQYEDLVEKVAVTRDVSRNPLFDTMFEMQNTGTQEIDIPGLKLVPCEYENKTAKFDLSLAAVEVEDKLLFTFEYNTKLFKPITIESLCGYFKNLVCRIIANPKIKLAEVEIISDATRKDRLNYFNEDLKEKFAIQPIQAILSASFQKYRENTAIEYGPIRLTYAELAHRIACISQKIAAVGIEKGSFIGIYSKDKADIISAVIAILNRACIFVPLDTNLPVKRIESMIKLADIRVILTDVEHETILYNLKESNPNIATIFAIYPTFYQAPELATANDQNTRYYLEDKVYVYFTSGTTGIPNVIAGKNESLVQFLIWQIEKFSIQEGYRISQLSAVGFDAFLRDVFIQLFVGGTVCIPGPTEMERLADWIESNRINLIHCVPSVFRLLAADQVTPAHYAYLKYIIMSGEPLKPNELKKWYEIFGDRIQLVNYYGTSETTMSKTYHFIRPNEVEAERIPAGLPMRGARLIILDKHLKPCAREVIGEIYIRTPYRTHGYLNNPGLNADRFIKNPFTEDDADLLHKTGDIGKELENGEIEVLGRVDRQVKIRGVRIELENIENCFLKHSMIEKAIVINRKDKNDDNYLCAYIVYKKQAFTDTGKIPFSLSTAQLREHLAKELPDYMIPSYFVPIEKVPLTPNGKIDTKSLPEPEIKIDGGHIAPRSPLEEKLVEFWGEILGIGKELIGIDANFFELGGHSLKVTTLLSRIHREMDVRVPLAEMFKAPTVKGLSGYIQAASGDINVSMEPMEEKEYYALSLAQKRLYFIQQRDLQDTGYNMPMILPLGKEIDADLLELALKRLIDRHESLRTSFQWVNGEVVQRVHKTVEFQVEYHDLAATVPAGQPYNAKDREEKTKLPDLDQNSALSLRHFIRPFDLSRAPLIRCGLIKHQDGNHTWVVDIHHIVSDGWSLELLQEEFFQVYGANKQGVNCDLEPLKIQYRDYAAWQNNLLSDEEKMARAKEFWKNYLSDANAALDLPYDFTSGPMNTKKSSAYRFIIEEGLAERLRLLAGEQRGSLFIVLLAAFNILLSHIACQDNILVGVPAAARQHWGLQNIVGLFVNTLILQSKVDSRETFSDFFAGFQANTINVLEYQDYPLELIFGELKIKYPEISAFFNMLNMGSSSQESIKDFNSYHFDEVPETKFPIHCYLTEYKNGIQVECHYFRELFIPETIEKIILIYARILENITISPSRKIKELAKKIERIKS